MLTLGETVVRPLPRTYTPDTPALAPELGRTFAALCKQSTPDGEERLRTITTALVERLKRDGVSPERIVVAIKAAIVRYGDQPGYPSLWHNTDDEETRAEAVYRHVFDWTVTALYADTNR